MNTPRLFFVAAVFCIGIPAASASEQLPEPLREVSELISADKHRDAAKRARRYADANPSDPRGWNWLSSAACTMAQKASLVTKLSWAKECLLALENHQALVPHLPSANAQLMSFYLQAPGIAGGGRDKADALVTKMAAQGPALGHFGQAFLARVDKRLGDYEKEMRLAIEAEPTEQRYRMDLATHYFASDRIADARQLFLDVLALDAENTYAHYQLGRGAALTGDKLEEGLMHLDRFVEINKPTSGLTVPAAHWRRAQILEKLGRLDEARVAIDLASAADLDIPEVEDDRKRIHQLSTQRTAAESR